MPASAAFFVVAEDSSFTPCIHCGVYLWLESRAEIIFFSYRMDAARALERRADAAERVDSLSDLPTNEFTPSFSLYRFVVQ